MIERLDSFGDALVLNEKIRTRINRFSITYYMVDERGICDGWAVEFRNDQLKQIKYYHMGLVRKTFIPGPQLELGFSQIFTTGVLGIHHLGKYLTVETYQDGSKIESLVFDLDGNIKSETIIPMIMKREVKEKPTPVIETNHISSLRRVVTHTINGLLVKQMIYFRDRLLKEVEVISGAKGGLDNAAVPRLVTEYSKNLDSEPRVRAIYHMVDGLMNGIRHNFSPYGVVTRILNLLNGFKHGRCYNIHPKHTVISTYKYNKIVTRILVDNPTKKVINRKDYINGNLITTTRYTSRGGVTVNHDI